jgi:Fe-S-cluster containining protein
MSEFPEIRCPKGCSKCCTPVLITRKEAAILELPEGTVSTGAREDGRCSFLGEDNLCTVYDKRPHICRAFGTSQQGLHHCGLVLTPVTERMPLEKVIDLEFQFFQENKEDVGRWFENPQILEQMIAQDEEQGFNVNSQKETLKKIKEEQKKKA